MTNHNRKEFIGNELNVVVYIAKASVNSNSVEDDTGNNILH